MAAGAGIRDGIEADPAEPLDIGFRPGMRGRPRPRIDGVAQQVARDVAARQAEVARRGREDVGVAGGVARLAWAPCRRGIYRPFWFRIDAARRPLPRWSAPGRITGVLSPPWAAYSAALLRCLIVSIPTELYRCHIHGEAFSTGSLIAHLFLFHDLRAAWIQGINGPLWSVAVEWHIYFLFALVLLPIWRRAGIAVMVLVAFLLGFAPAFMFPNGHNFAWACPWFLGLFALGAMVACFTFSPDEDVQRRMQSTPWGAITLVLLGGLIAALHVASWWSYYGDDVLVGLLCCSFICYVIQVLRRPQEVGQSLPFARRAIGTLENRWLVALGGFSYSLYLTHFPLLSTLDTLFKKRVHSSTQLMIFQLLLVLPICLIAASIFSRLFERPFMRRRDKSVVSTNAPEKAASG